MPDNIERGNGRGGVTSIYLMMMIEDDANVAPKTFLMGNLLVRICPNGITFQR